MQNEERPGEATSCDIKATPMRVDSQLIATLKPSQCAHNATPKPPQGHPNATLKRPQGSHKAPTKPPEGYLQPRGMRGSKAVLL